MLLYKIKETGTVEISHKIQENKSVTFIHFIPEWNPSYIQQSKK